MKELTTHVGLDVCKASIQVAALLPDGSWFESKQDNDAKGIGRLGRRLQKESVGRIVCCYEAGVCGFALQRALEAEGLRCLVIAPSLIPQRPGDRIKTDRRDARRLAELLRADELTEVAPPTPEEEHVRDLCRARSDAQTDLERARHRLSKWLLRHGLHYAGGKKAWTQAHRRWLDGLQIADEIGQEVLAAHRRAVTDAQERLAHLDVALETIAGREPYATVVGHLRCFRGIDTLTAISVVAELHGFLRFESAPGLMAYLGLVPSEHTTAGKPNRGSITRTGNGRVRRLLNQSAWHYRHKPAVGAALRVRRKDQPAWVVEIADQAMKRLHRRWWHLVVGRNKQTPVATVAIERELVGFIWAVMRRDAEAAAGTERSARAT